jgi:hypothetical protein
MSDSSCYSSSDESENVGQQQDLKQSNNIKIIDEMSAKLAKHRQRHNRNIKAYLSRKPEQRDKAKIRSLIQRLRKMNYDLDDDAIYMLLTNDEERYLYLIELLKLEKE